jgi:hypothetical protein
MFQVPFDETEIAVGEAEREKLNELNKVGVCGSTSHAEIS